MAGKKWIGPSPIIGTLKYLDKGDIFLHKGVEIMAFNYLKQGTTEETEGAKRFVKYRLPQLQHRNPGIQFMAYEDMTPTPFLQVFLKNNHEMLIDLFGKSSSEIWTHLKNLFGTSRNSRNNYSKNRALIGTDKSQFDCVCKMPGQLRCSSDLKNTFRFGRRDELWSRDYLTWYSSGYHKIRTKKERIENT